MGDFGIGDFDSGNFGIGDFDSGDSGMGPFDLGDFDLTLCWHTARFLLFWGYLRYWKKT